MSRIDNRPLNQRIADAHWQPVKKSNDRSPLERAIESKEAQLSRKKLHGDKLVLQMAKDEQRKRDAEFDERERRTEHLERNRGQIIHLQNLLSRYEENESIPEEMLVAVRKSLAQVSDPDGCQKTANEMYRACFNVEQERQDAIAKGIADRRDTLEAELAELRKYEFPADIAEKQVVKVRLRSTDLDGQARELFSKLCESTEHSFEETDNVLEALRAHRAGNSQAMLAAIEKYVDSSPVESEGANDSDAS